MHSRSPQLNQPPQHLWQDLTFATAPNGGQLDNIKTHLDLVLLALEALVGIGSDAILKTAKELGLEAGIGDRVGLWRLRQSNPLRKSSGGRKKLDVEEARSLVLIICCLSQQHQELVRRAVTLLEQMVQDDRPLYQVALLGDYLDNFSNIYQERMGENAAISSAELESLACKFLIDLLFYSAANGHRRLWLALIG